MDSTASDEAITGALRAVNAAQPRCGATKVVAIDGPSGSGKTRFAAILAESLPNAYLLHLDDLYPGWDGLMLALTTVHDQVLAPLARGERAEYRLWDWVHNRYAGWHSFPATDLLIVDGVGSGAGPGAQLVSVLIWLEADHEVRLQRAMARDGQSYLRHWRGWAAQENALFALEQTRNRADLILNTSDLTGGWA